MNFLTYLKQPFPKLESRWKLIISISIFVALFLIILQPFDINLMKKGTGKIIILSGYGLVTFIVLFINLIIIEHIFKKTFNERNWTIAKEFSWLMWIIFSIGLGNALYTMYLIDFFKINFLFFVKFQIITVTVGVFPTTILIISKQKYLLRKNLNSASDLNKNLAKDHSKSVENILIRFVADNDKDFTEFYLNNFYFIESSGNYIELFIKENDKLTRKTFRSTLKRSLDFFADAPEIIQCHRAFIVNTNKITNAKGNSQGLRLNLERCDTEVPVSRGYVEKIKNKLG